MELKTKYQYTYFVYPYMVSENKFDKYLLKLLKDKKCKVRFFEKEKDLELYSYFMPTIQDFMFQSFEFTKDKIRGFEQFNKEMQSVILSKYPCIMFDYDMGQDVQGKAGEKEGIFFNVQKIQLVCFNTGICFLLMKTNIEDSNSFAEVLNFNYKFRDIHFELKELKKYENIRLQTTTFSDVKKLTELITEITGSEANVQKVDIDTNRFLTYAYTCIEQKDWNEVKGFKDIEFEFFKYANILPSSYKSTFDKKQVETLAKMKYIKTGFTKEGTALLSSGMDTYNYTKLPYIFEHQYLYIYLFVQYQKIYLKKLENEYKQGKHLAQIREKFIAFSKKLWLQEVTNDDMGSCMYKKNKTVSEVEKIYHTIKSKFDIAYKELNIEKETKINKVILIVLGVSLLLNVINFIMVIKQII